MRIFRILSFFAALLLMGCHSEMVHVTLINTSSQPLATIVVDYPGGTFGVNQLGPGKTFPYNLKVLDGGNLKIQFTDALGHDHKYAGPPLYKHDAGSLRIKLTQDGASVESDFSHR
jgi:hypothetical protein